VVLNEQALTNFSIAIHNLRTLTEQAMGTVGDINNLILTNGEQVGSAISNIVYFSQELNKLAGSAQTILTTNGTEISEATKNIESATEDLKHLADNLQAGQGLAGTVLQNQQLATNVQAIASNLSITTSNLNRLGLWHFLWHREPLPTNAAPALTNH
jgi:ABC-type transporter Mla subunit MlaD